MRHASRFYHERLHPRAARQDDAVFDADVVLGRTRDLELIGVGRTPLEGDLARVAAAQALTIVPEENTGPGWYHRSETSLQPIAESRRGASYAGGIRTDMGARRRIIHQLPLLRERRALAYAAALLLSALAWWIRWALDAAFPPGFPYLTFFPAVIISSFLFGRGPGTLSAFVCGILAWYFFIPPTHAFDLGTRTFVALGFYVGVVTVDIGLIHAMQQANERSSRSALEQGRLAERTELLFNELQHRVSNNIQMVGAMLSLQQRQVLDPIARMVLADASTKLQLIGRIQRQLYSTSGEQVPLDMFLRDLMADLFAADGRTGIIHRIEAVPGVRLSPDAAIPLALIMAEGIANAMEHGFAHREVGLVLVTLTLEDDVMELCVIDDGAGLPPDFDIHRSDSLGLKLVRSLAAQIGAQLSIENGAPSGTVLRLSLPESACQV